jgi:hypothetical protein
MNPTWQLQGQTIADDYRTPCLFAHLNAQCLITHEFSGFDFKHGRRVVQDNAEILRKSLEEYEFIATMPPTAGFQPNQIIIH